MCASYQSRFNLQQLVEAFDKAGAPLNASAGLPNVPDVNEVRPTERATVVLAGADGAAVLKTLSFGFPPPDPRPDPSSICVAKAGCSTTATAPAGA